MSWTVLSELSELKVSGYIVLHAIAYVTGWCAIFGNCYLAEIFADDSLEFLRLSLAAAYGFIGM